MVKTDKDILLYIFGLTLVTVKSNIGHSKALTGQSRSLECSLIPGGALPLTSIVGNFRSKDPRFWASPIPLTPFFKLTSILLTPYFRNVSKFGWNSASLPQISIPLTPYFLNLVKNRKFFVFLMLISAKFRSHWPLICSKLPIPLTPFFQQLLNIPTQNPAECPPREFNRSRDLFDIKNDQ